MFASFCGVALKLLPDQANGRVVSTRTRDSVRASRKRACWHSFFGSLPLRSPPRLNGRCIAISCPTVRHIMESSCRSWRECAEKSSPRFGRPRSRTSPRFGWAEKSDESTGRVAVVSRLVAGRRNEPIFLSRFGIVARECREKNRGAANRGPSANPREEAAYVRYRVVTNETSGMTRRRERTDPLGNFRNEEKADASVSVNGKCFVDYGAVPITSRGRRDESGGRDGETIAPDGRRQWWVLIIINFCVRCSQDFSSCDDGEVAYYKINANKNG